MGRQRAGEVRHPVRLALGRGALWLVKWCALAVVAVAAAPVTAVAAGAFWYGWWRGAPPRRVAAAAVWCLPMVAAWLVAVAAWPRRPGDGPAGVGGGSWWLRVLAAPPRAWDAMWVLAWHGHLAGAAVAAAPPAIPLGIVAGALGWSYRLLRMRSGTGGLTPHSPGAFDARQWRHQVRAARGLAAAPGSLPLLSPAGHVVAGATIRSVRHRTGRAAAIPYERLRAHQVVIGSTGTGNPVPGLTPSGTRKRLLARQTAYRFRLVWHDPGTVRAVA
jgi:hypothetical protein